MSHYPTPYTYDDVPTCPGCGYEWEADYETVSYDDGGTTDLECPDCGMRLECTTHVSYNFEIAHPKQCAVKGYHVPYINEKYSKHECLYCHRPLTCDCKLHDRCKHGGGLDV